MDTNNLQVAKPSTSTSESAPKYTFKRPFRQCFLIPYPIIKYMIQNPQSGKVWKKLITSCKYFYPNYPVYPVKSLDVRYSRCKADEEYFDSSKPFPKLWIYDYFSDVMGSGALITKVFKFDLHHLCLFHQSLTFQEYQKLTSSGSFERIELYSCEIKNPDGTFVTADKLLENLEHLKAFSIDLLNSLMFQPGTVKKMIQHLKRFENMRRFVLLRIEETFDFSSFVDFLMKNETIDIDLSFDEYRPFSAAYKETVQNVVKEIKKNPSLKVPDIEFCG